MELSQKRRKSILAVFPIQNLQQLFLWRETAEIVEKVKLSLPTSLAAELAQNMCKFLRIAHPQDAATPFPHIHLSVLQVRSTRNDLSAYSGRHL